METELDVTLSGDLEMLVDWADGAPGVTLRQGAPGVQSVVIRGDWGEVLL